MTARRDTQEKQNEAFQHEVKSEISTVKSDLTAQCQALTSSFEETLNRSLRRQDQQLGHTELKALILDKAVPHKKAKTAKPSADDEDEIWLLVSYVLQSNGHFAPCIQFALLILELLLAVSTWIFCFQLEGLQLFGSFMELCHKVWMNEHCIRIVTIQSPAISSIYHSWHLKQSMRGDLDTTSVSSVAIFPCFVRMLLHAACMFTRSSGRRSL